MNILSVIIRKFSRLKIKDVVSQSEPPEITDPPITPVCVPETAPLMVSSTEAVGLLLNKADLADKQVEKLEKKVKRLYKPRKRKVKK